MQSRLAVSVLSGIAQRLVGERGAVGKVVKARRLAGDFPEAAVLAAPLQRAAFVGGLQRRPVQVGAEPQNLAPPAVSPVVNPRQRAVGLVRVVNVCPAPAVMLLLLQQPVALLQEVGFAEPLRSFPGV